MVISEIHKLTLTEREENAYPVQVTQETNLFPHQSIQESENGGTPLLSLRGGGGEEDDEELEDYKEESDDVVEPDIGLNTPTAVKLFGFQGWVAFNPQDILSFKAAVKKLLSMGDHEDNEFNISIFNKTSKRVVHEIADSFPVTVESPAWKDIQTMHWGEENTLFVKAGSSERTPSFWEPEEEDGAGKVTKISLEDGSACCYVAFPSTSSITDIRDWGNNQYTPYIRTALEVLLGIPVFGRHHALFGIRKSSQTKLVAPFSYGLHAIDPFELLSIFHSNSKQQYVLNCLKLLEDEIVFVLPGYPTKGLANTDVIENRVDTASCLIIQPKPRPNSGKLGYRDVPNIIRDYVAPYLMLDRDNTTQRVDICALDSSLSAQTLNNISEHTLNLLDDSQYRGKEEAEADEFFTNSVSQGQKFFAIYPKWGAEGPRMFPNWQVSQEGFPKVNMPPFRYPRGSHSIASDFQKRFKTLIETDQNEAVKLKPYSIVSIKPLPFGKPTLSKVDNIPTYFLPSTANNEDWHGVEAMIGTSAVSVGIVDSEVQHWKLQISKSNIWGPRYGRMSYKTLPKARPSCRKARSIHERPEFQNVQINDHYPLTTASLSSREGVLSEGASISSPRTENRGAPVRSEERSSSWLSQPSAFSSRDESGNRLHIPVTAPPADAFLRTTSSVPMVTKAVLTLTEQIRLQKAFWDMRNMLIGRAVECSYEDCDFNCPGDERHLLSEHLQTAHMVHGCLWCSTPLYEWWNEEQRNDHLRQKHFDKLIYILGGRNATVERHQGNRVVSIPMADFQGGLCATKTCLPLTTNATYQDYQTQNFQNRSVCRFDEEESRTAPASTPVQNTKRASVSAFAASGGLLGTETTKTGDALQKAPVQITMSSNKGLQQSSKTRTAANASSWSDRGTELANVEISPRSPDRVASDDDYTGQVSRELRDKLQISTKGSRRRLRQSRDGTWRYESDSPRDIEADEQAMREVIPEEEEWENNEASKKRRKAQDGSYKPTRDEELSVDEDIRIGAKKGKKATPSGPTNLSKLPKLRVYQPETRLITNRKQQGK